MKSVLVCGWLALSVTAPAVLAQDMVGPSGDRPGRVPVMPPEAAEPQESADVEATDSHGFRYQREWQRLHDAGRHREAAELASTWHNDAVIQIGEHSAPAAAALAALGDSYQALSDPIRAARAYKDSIQAAERANGVFDRSLVGPLTSLGMLYFDQRDYEASVEALMRAKDITHRNQGIYNQEQDLIVNALTESLIGLGENRQATREQRFLYGVAKEAYGKDSPELVPALQKWALWNIRLHRYFEARRTFREALRILEQAYGPNDPRLIETLNMTARAFSRTVEYDDLRWRRRDGFREGVVALRRAVEVYRAQDFVDQIDLLRQQSRLADLYMMSESRATGIETYSAAITEAREAGLSDDVIDAMYGLPRLLVPTRRPLGLNRLQLEQLGAGPHRVVFEFDLDAAGRPRNVRAIEDTVGYVTVVKVMRQRLIGNVFRPRFVEGRPVPTYGVRIQYIVYPERDIAVPSMPTFDDASDSSPDAEPDEP